MEIIFRGKNIKVGLRVQELAREKLAKFERFKLRSPGSRWISRRSAIPGCTTSELCEVTVHLKGHFVKAHAASDRPDRGARSGDRQGRAPADAG